MMTRNDFPMSILTELAKLAPGEICLYQPTTGLEHSTIRVLSELSKLKNKYGFTEEQCPIVVRQTEDNDSFLMEHIFARREADNGETYPVYISTIYDLYGLLNKVWGVLPSGRVYSISTGTEEPVEIMMTGGNNTTTGGVDTDGESTANPCACCPLMDKENGLHLLSTKVPTQREIEMKMESLLSDCVQYGYNIDFQALMDEIKEEGNNMDKYSLELDYEIRPVAFNRRWATYVDMMTKCDIYIVAPNGRFKLDLSPIEKAVYLTYMSYDEGIPTQGIKNAFIDRIKSIYNVMPDKVKNKTKGIMTKSTKDFSLTTLIVHISNIRVAIQEHIKNSQLVNEFAIEGYKNEPFMVKRAPKSIKDFLADIAQMNTEPHTIS